jgi:hypothetical protein
VTYPKQRALNPRDPGRSLSRTDVGNQEKKVDRGIWGGVTFTEGGRGPKPSRPNHTHAGLRPRNSDYSIRWAINQRVEKKDHSDVRQGDPHEGYPGRVFNYLS